MDGATAILIGCGVAIAGSLFSLYCKIKKLRREVSGMSDSLHREISGVRDALHGGVASLHDVISRIERRLDTPIPHMGDRNP